MVTVALTNTGDVEGKEVVQLYLRDKFASVTRPVRELKGFELVSLKPSERRTINFELTEKELGFYDNNGNWLVESGAFEVYVGGSSATQNMAEFSLE
jgi:beta-glucosidase